MYKAIAKAGHICYASTKEGDEEAFVKRCIKMDHMRPLEFGTVYMKIPTEYINSDLIQKYSRNPYTKIQTNGGFANVTTNFRVIVENEWQKDMMEFMCGPTSDHYKRYTFVWNISRAIADEFRTHTSISSLMQSTRYCAYDSNKFGGQLQVMCPTWIKADGSEEEKEYLKALIQAEYHYFKLRKLEVSAENARGVLPLDIATEMIQCAFAKDWEQFFNLRMKGTTGAPHPDAKFIAEKAYELFKPEEPKWNY